MAVLLVQHIVYEELVSDATEVGLAAVYCLTGSVVFVFVDNRAARRLLATTSLAVIGFAVGYGLAVHGTANFAVVLLLLIRLAVGIIFSRRLLRSSQRIYVSNRAAPICDYRYPNKIPRTHPNDGA